MFEKYDINKDRLVLAIFVTIAVMILLILAYQLTTAKVPQIATYIQNWITTPVLTLITLVSFLIALGLKSVLGELYGIKPKTIDSNVQPTTEQNEFIYVVFGTGGAGKTCFIDYLSDREYRDTEITEKPDEKYTFHVSIKGKEFKCSSLDYEGQKPNTLIKKLKELENHKKVTDLFLVLSFYEPKAEIKEKAYKVNKPASEKLKKKNLDNQYIEQLDTFNSTLLELLFNECRSIKKIYIIINQIDLFLDLGKPLAIKNFAINHHRNTINRIGKIVDQTSLVKKDCFEYRYISLKERKEIKKEKNRWEYTKLTLRQDLRAGRGA
ncbi:GTPase domain-containing protein [Marinagarivorans cellulosilyticus]|uniref:G domain-containing protein n=1 Tax=Marinagarivorans cellulosilyticus TaxID=2721545 RepID=A0AAN2BIV6_9GAMM|nr:GTPase domain-containing protein [Marinagarivorans cellulosilyticus]BCD96289.1 hypothetical protein MARGE09_P0489 [Marinagarivorans cellulosilyticus]